MTRVVRFAACLWMACWMLGVRSAEAQAPVPLSEEGTYRAEFVGGPTFGNKASGSLGGEFDYRLSEGFDVFFEAGHMFDVATSDIENRADRVGAFIGATADAKQAVNYFNVGVKYRFPVFGYNFFTIWVPYIGLAGGVATVKNRTKFEVNGTDVTDQLLDQYGVELGNDLTDSQTKGMLTIVVGAQRKFRNKYFIDISYRYGRIYAKSDAIVDDVAIGTNRVQGGFGMHF
jgi:opacity protein-like surface antigen